MRLHWNQIVDLRKHAGELDVDSGKIFIRFHGLSKGEDFYEGEPVFYEPNLKLSYKEFSFRAVAGLSPLVVEATEVPIELTESDEIVIDSDIASEDVTDDSDSRIDGTIEDQASTDGGWDREERDRGF